MRTLDFVRGKWPVIFEYYGLPPVTGIHHYKGECPICGKKGKFRIDDKDGAGTFICVCDAGDGWKLLQITTGKDFKTLAGEIDRAFGNTFEYEKKEKPVNDILQQTVTRFRQISPIAGTLGEQYLNSRGIFQMPTGGIKYSDSEYNTDTNSRYPCLFAIASNEFSEPIQRHLTYLNGSAKANVPKVKKALSLTRYDGSIAVKLFSVKSTLGIAEGIETALSAHQLYKMPVWSTLNATLMKKFRAPPGVTHLVVFADNDRNGTGLAAAFECAKSNLLSKNDVNSVLVRWPELPDFNDMLQRGCKVFEWSLSN